MVGKRQLPSLGPPWEEGVWSLLRGGSESGQQGKGAPEENPGQPHPKPTLGATSRPGLRLGKPCPFLWPVYTDRKHRLCGCERLRLG